MEKREVEEGERIGGRGGRGARKRGREGKERGREGGVGGDRGREGGKGEKEGGRERENKMCNKLTPQVCYLATHCKSLACKSPYPSGRVTERSEPNTIWFK